MFRTLSARPIGGTEGAYLTVVQEHIEKPELGRFVVLDSKTLSVHRTFSGPNRKDELNAEVLRLIEATERAAKTQAAKDFDELLKEAAATGE